MEWWNQAPSRWCVNGLSLELQERLLRCTTPCLALLLALAPMPGWAKPLVRLLIPVDSADEYERVMAEVDEARLTALEGQAFVVAASLADAGQAYELGRALQARLKLPFELLYDEGHPQADLAWFSRLHPSLLPPLPPLPPLPERIR